MSKSIVLSSLLASDVAIKFIGNTYFVNKIHAPYNIILARGTPKIIQSNIDISTPYVSCMKALNTIFGAVPINVDIPPIVAAYAIPKSNAVSKFDLSFSDKPGIVSDITPQTANPIGSSIRVVEVFITHMLISAATSIKPPTNFLPLEPTEIIIFNAILLCNPELSIPSANINPPKNKYMFLLA